LLAHEVRVLNLQGCKKIGVYSREGKYKKMEFMGWKKNEEESIFRDVPAGAIYVEGKTKLRLPDKEVIKNQVYTGYLVKGLPHGHGILTYPTGNKRNDFIGSIAYEGNFTEGKKDGVMTVTEEGKSPMQQTFTMDVLQLTSEERERERLIESEDKRIARQSSLEDMYFGLKKPARQVQNTRRTVYNRSTPGRVGGKSRRKRSRKTLKKRKAK
jgi:hypothetical protein